MDRRYRILATVLVLVAALAFAWKVGVAKLREENDKVSGDALSLGLGERWGGGLPAGYTAEIADDLETAGHLYARLTYRESAASLLERWDAPTAAQAEAFRALVEAHRAADIPPDHRDLLASADISPDGTWLAYSAEKDGAQLVLLYDCGENVLYLAESK